MFGRVRSCVFSIACFKKTRVRQNARVCRNACLVAVLYMVSDSKPCFGTCLYKRRDFCDLCFSVFCDFCVSCFCVFSVVASIVIL